MHMADDKLLRHRAIQDLLGRFPVRSQDELVELLEQQDIEVTQATLSRDFRELGVVKTPEGYRLPGDVIPQPQNGERLPGLVRELVRSEVAARNLVVLKTPPGSAQPVALALDQTPPRHVVGTVAGDDTILVITDSDTAARTLVRQIRTWKEPSA
jgi:transcriptional regulator of arginine metabolism